MIVICLLRVKIALVEEIGGTSQEEVDKLSQKYHEDLSNLARR